MNETILKAESISLIYASRSSFMKTFKHKALDNISFNVDKGDVCGILGRNGSGKSSLLKVLAGIIKPDEGKLEISEGISRSLLSLGLGFNSELTGRDNALISCMLNGMSKKSAKKILDDIKEFTELGKFFDQPVKTYSSGMRSRLGFATGVLLETDILLIDETLSVGDHIFREKAEATLLDKMNGRTVIFVSHSEDQIEKLCNKCIWLEAGKIVHDGSVIEVMNTFRKGKNN